MKPATSASGGLKTVLLAAGVHHITLVEWLIAQRCGAFFTLPKPQLRIMKHLELILGEASNLPASAS
jgi:hypothetical protein